MNWWIFIAIDTSTSVDDEKNDLHQYGWSKGGGEETYDYSLISDRNCKMMCRLSNKVQGGAFVQVNGFKPELPPGFSHIPVRRVTAVGAPAHDAITPGLYEINGASANVTKNGGKLKIELTARDCNSAWEIYRAILRNDPSDGTCIIAYAA